MLHRTQFLVRGCRAALAVGGLFMLATGCTVGPDYQRPAIDLPASFRDAPAGAQAASLADRPWWEIFDDAALTTLIDEGLLRNHDLCIAVARIEQARGLRAQVRADRFPRVGYHGVASRGRNDEFGEVEFTDNQTQTSSFLTLNAVWEIDLWGRIRRADEAALAEMLAREESRRGIAMTLVSEIAQNYFRLVALDELEAISLRNRDGFGESMGIFEQRFEGGIESQVPVLRARALQSDAAASLPQIQRERAQVENRLNVLIGRAPQAIERTSTLSGDFMFAPDVPVGLPSDLLERRPDVREAEANLRAASARIGVAKAEYFPRIGLTALFGGVSSDLAEFSSGSGAAWSLSANIAGPIFQAGRLRGQTAQARAEWDEAVARYEQTIFTALREVADALISRQKLGEIETEQQRAVDALREAVGLLGERFSAGRADYFEVLEAQRELFPAERALAETRIEQRVAFIQLYQALGGGWRLDDERAGSTPVETMPASAPTFESIQDEMGADAPNFPKEMSPVETVTTPPE